MSVTHISLGMALLSSFDRSSLSEKPILLPVNLLLRTDKVVTFSFKSFPLEAERLLVMDPVSVANSRKQIEVFFPHGYQVIKPSELKNPRYPQGYAWNTPNHYRSWDSDTNKRLSGKLKAAIKVETEWEDRFKVDELVYSTNSEAPGIIKIHNGTWQEDLFGEVFKQTYDLRWVGHPNIYVKYNTYMLRAMSRTFSKEKETHVFFAGVGWTGMVPLIPKIAGIED